MHHTKKQYIMYSYNIMLNQEPDLFEDVEQAEISEAQSVLDGMLHEELHLSCSKNATEELPLDIHLEKEADGIFLFVLQRPKDVKYMEGFSQQVIESHPACYVIVDNREDVCQLAIEKSSQFSLPHQKVADAIAGSLNKKLSKRGLKMAATLQKDPEDFWRVVDKRVVADNDPIRWMRIDLLDPKKACVNGGNKEVLRRIVSRHFLDLFSRSAKLQMILGGTEDAPLVDKHAGNELANLAQIASLCAVNCIDITLRFQSKKELSMHGPEYMVCMIENQVIEDFKEGKTSADGDRLTTALEMTLDSYLDAHNF